MVMSDRPPLRYSYIPRLSVITAASHDRPSYLYSVAAVHPHTGFKPGNWTNIVPLGNATPVGTYGNTGLLSKNQDGSPVYGEAAYSAARQRQAESPGGMNGYPECEFTPAVKPVRHGVGIPLAEAVSMSSARSIQTPPAGEVQKLLLTDFKLQNPVDATTVHKQHVNKQHVNVLEKMHTEQAALSDSQYFSKISDAQTARKRTSFITPAPIDISKHPDYGLNTHGNLPRFDNAAPNYIYERAPLQYITSASNDRVQQYQIAMKANLTQQKMLVERMMQDAKGKEAGAKERRRRTVGLGLGTPEEIMTEAASVETSSWMSHSTSEGGKFTPLIQNIKGGIPMPPDVPMKQGKPEISTFKTYNTPDTSSRGKYSRLMSQTPGEIKMSANVTPDWQKPWVAKPPVQQIPTGTVSGAPPAIRSVPRPTRNATSYFDDVLETFDKKLEGLRPIGVLKPSDLKHRSAPVVPTSYYPKTNDPHAPRSVASDAIAPLSQVMLPPPPPVRYTRITSVPLSAGFIRPGPLETPCVDGDDLPLASVKQHLEDQKRTDGKRPMVSVGLSVQNEAGLFHPKPTRGPGLKRSNCTRRASWNMREVANEKKNLK